MLSFWSSKSEIQASFTRQAHVLPAYDVQLALHFTWSGRFDETVAHSGRNAQTAKAVMFSLFDCFPTVSLFVCVHLCFALLSVRAFGDRTLRQQYRSSLKAEMRGMSLDMFELLNFQLCYVLVILVQSDAFHIVQMHSASFRCIQHHSAMSSFFLLMFTMLQLEC